MSSFMDKLFDFDGDGELDMRERRVRMGILSEVFSDESDDDEFDDNLDVARLDRDDLEFMDDEERREFLEEAGLNPDDCDF